MANFFTCSDYIPMWPHSLSFVCVASYIFHLITTIIIWPSTLILVLQDILANEAIQLDWLFRYSLINDIIRVSISVYHNVM